MSVERIATKADVNKTSVYRRWPTREKLASAALERILVDVSAAVPDTCSLRGDLLGLLAPVARLLESPLGLTVARFAIARRPHRARTRSSRGSYSTPRSPCWPSSSGRGHVASGAATPMPVRWRASAREA